MVLFHSYFPFTLQFFVQLVHISGPIPSTPILIGGFEGVEFGLSMSFFSVVADYVLLACPDCLFAIFVGCFPLVCLVVG